MSASQRRKGSGGEREVCRLLEDEFGTPVARKLGQARNGGNDIDLPPFCIEVKRRGNIALHDWMSQAETACKPGEIPMVLARGDGEAWMVIVPWRVAARWMREELHEMGENK
jgi:hypothetical protein